MRLTRRSMIAALPLAATCAGAEKAPRLFITPHGEGDGGAWDSAASLADLDDLIARVAPGGEILISAGDGPYLLTDPIEVSAGGGRDRAIKIGGVNRVTGTPAAALVRGPEPAPGEQGPDAFRLLRGARHLHFSHFAFERVGNGCFRIAGPVTGLVIEDCSFEGVYRFLENTGSDETRAHLRDFAIRRCSGRGAVRGFARVRYGSSDGVFEDCAAEGVANEGGDIPAGCALDDQARRITFRRCVMENFQQWRAGDYWNGDGFSDEFENRDIVYESCVARGATDGGFDCKSERVVLRDCVAEDNKRNFRIWSRDATLTRCVSRTPNYRGAAEEAASACHIWVGHEEARARIEDLTVEDEDAEAAILEFEHEEARVEIRGLTIRAPRENWGEAGERVEAGMILAR